MNYKEHYFDDFELNNNAESQFIDALRKKGLPEDYLDFLSKYNGGEGYIGEFYFIAWKAEDLIQFNLDYESQKYAPGVFLFASNGGGEAFGFQLDQDNIPVVQLPFIGMSNSNARPVASSFDELLEKMLNDDEEIY